MNYFGIDVHSTYHKVIGTTADGSSLEFDIPNDREGRERLQELMLEHSPCAVAMEACTGAYQLYDLLEPVTKRLSLLHPGDFRVKFPKLGRKNDKIDAAALCQAARLALEGIWVPDESIRQRRILSAKRVSLTQRRTQSKNSLKSAFREYHIPLAKNPWGIAGMKTLKERLVELPETVALGARLEIELIEAYNRAINELDQRMAELTSTDHDIKLLMSIAGISYYSGFVIMAEVGCIDRFASAKQLSGYAGLDPRVSQSGKSGPRLGSITKRGRSRLRWILVECAHVAARHNPKLQRLYWRVKKRSGNGNKATVAVARKLLTLCYHILKSGRPYSEVHEDKYRAKLRKTEGVGRKRKAALLLG